MRVERKPVHLSPLQFDAMSNRRWRFVPEALRQAVRNRRCARCLERALAGGEPRRAERRSIEAGVAQRLGVSVVRRRAQQRVSERIDALTRRDTEDDQEEQPGLDCVDPPLFVRLNRREQLLEMLLLRGDRCRGTRELEEHVTSRAFDDCADEAVA